MTTTRQRALAILSQCGIEVETAGALVSALEREGIRLVDTTRGELACRWVDVRERAVPASADTIIRTVSRTRGEQTASNTHWLDGLLPPPFSEEPPDTVAP